MGLDSVKVMENWQSKTSNESDKKKKRRRKKKNNVRNTEHVDEEEEEANGCWVKFRFIVCCVSSASDVDSSLSLSTSTGIVSSSGSSLLWSNLFSI